MVDLRKLRWPEDRLALLALDTSFSTERIHRVATTPNGFVMNEGSISPPLDRAFDLTGEVDQIPAMDDVWIAEVDNRLVGIAALSFDRLDRRAIVRHLYVDRAFRRQGVGGALMDAVVARAALEGLRCVWLETQDVNYDAVRFYRRAGFQWCGLDLSLDDRDGSPNDETAIFFMLQLESAP